MNVNSFKVMLALSLGLSLAACENDSGSRTNIAPTITAVSNISIEANQESEAILFQVDDEFTDAASLVVAAASENEVLIPSTSLSFLAVGGSRSVSITPTGELLGMSNITLTVSDGELTASTTFSITVIQQIISVGQFAVLLFSDDANDSPRNFNSRQIVAGNEDVDLYPAVTQ